MDDAAEPVDFGLVERFRSGDTDAFSELVRRHHGRVKGLCSSLLYDRSEIDDAVQDIFLKVYRSLDHFHGKARFSTWLYRIVMNHCVDIRRKAAQRRTQSLDALLELETNKSDRLLETPDRASDQAERAEEREVALSYFDSLPEDYRALLALRETQGLSYAEIARTKGISVDSVKAKLRRARAEIREKLRHFLGHGRLIEWNR
jgi:RNA polymerase sigma-70 factor (ECF subfamily)